MLKVIDGDIDKLGLLYERYKMPMYGYFFKLTSGNRDASEDLVHNVFYKALKYKHSFKGRGEFSKWLFSIAHNIGIDYLRKDKGRYTEEINDDRISGCYEDKGIEKQQERELLFCSLEKLEANDRELLILSKIKCLKYSEIADMLNSTESAVKTRAFRALKKLRKIYYKLENVSYERK